jgi:hypothetical protein
MKRVLSVASIVVAVTFALRPEPRAVVVKTAEHRVRLDSATQRATVHANLRNNTRDSTNLLGCLGVPAFTIERHVGNRWVKVGDFPCPSEKAYSTMTLARSQTITVPLRVRGPGDYRLSVVWIPHGYWANQGRHATSAPFEVR